MAVNDYYKNIVDYYDETENAYKDSWDLDSSLAIHYGYWDEKVNSFPQSLLRMNEVMMEAANIGSSDKVLDAGCGVGGSSLFLASRLGCRVTGITLSERQVQLANKNAESRGMKDLVKFEVMNYEKTSFPDEYFDVVWGCESVCYASSKEQFIREAFRILKPGGRLVIADGFVARPELNDHPLNRKWLDGWQVKYLESPAGFQSLMKAAGFEKIIYRDITVETAHSSRRLFRYYYLARLYLLWKKLKGSREPSPNQKNNISACKFQFYSRKKGLSLYGLIVGTKM
jgi:tocopherol O-methyltransferase